MEKNIVELGKILAKMERYEKGLGTNLEKLGDSQQFIASCKDELVLEVEEMKSLRRSLREGVIAALKDNAQIIIPQLLPSLVKGFQEQTQAFVESSLKESQRLKDEIDRSVSQVTGLISTQKKEMTVRVAALAFVFCLSSLMTAGGIFYFFPQEIHYGLSDRTLKTYFVGEAVMDVFNKLTPNDQALIKEKMNSK
jgi:hypothetical protein